MNPVSLFALPLLGALLAGCASAPEPNPTAFDYVIGDKLEGRLAGTGGPQGIEQVVIAPMNYGNPSPGWLAEGREQVDAALAARLREAGIEVLPERQFMVAWEGAKRRVGDIMNPTLGLVDDRAFGRALSITLDTLQERGEVDAVVFTNLLLRRVGLSSGRNHYAKWDGVSRRPSLRGASDGIPAGFDWGQPLRVSSLAVFVFAAAPGSGQERRLFTSVGGLELVDRYDFRRGGAPEKKRRDDLFESPDHIGEAVALALHPFVSMDAYPGPEQPARDQRQARRK